MTSPGDPTVPPRAEHAAFMAVPDLFSRRGLPTELSVLAVRHPREGWQTHPNLGEMAAFWLARHGMFRELCAALGEAATAFGEERVDAAIFLPWFSPRFGFFLNELQTHHHVEDHHYFPIFRRADPRLARGFEILDADHAVLDRSIHDLARAGATLKHALGGHGDVATARARLADGLARMVAGLARHLDDEEDLVIPLILERTEAGLGV